jgi:hypothetical protein
MKFNFVILFVLFLGSCTITKRIHNQGWHVEWRHKYSANVKEFSYQAEKESIIEDVYSDNRKHRIAENNFPLESGNDYESDHVVTASKSIDVQPSKLEVIPIENEAIHREEQDIQKTLLLENTVEKQKDKKMPPPLRTAVTLTLVSLFVSFIVLASVSVLSPLMFILLVLTQLTLSVFAAINSNQALRQIKAKPDLWKGKKLAKFLLFFGIIGLVALVVLQVIAFNMNSNQYNFDALFDGFFL